jgi:hypothetical protein
MGKRRATEDRGPKVSLRVRNKHRLISKVVPIFDQYAIMGPKIMQYIYFRTHLVELHTKLH